MTAADKWPTPDLNGNCKPFTALGQVTLIAPVQTTAPAAADRTRCRTYGTESLHLQRSPQLDAANDALAHLGEDAINNPDSAGNHVSLTEVASG